MIKPHSDNKKGGHVNKISVLYLVLPIWSLVKEYI